MMEFRRADPEFEAIIARLVAGEGIVIGNYASKGVVEAAEVIRWYDFMAKAPGDPGGQMLFTMAYETWRKVAAVNYGEE